MSEKNGHVLSQRDIADHDLYVEEIQNSLAIASRRLIEVRDRKLYLLYTDSFEEWGKKFLNRSRSWLYQQIEIEEVKEALPPEMSRKLDTDSAALELAKVPKKRRMRLIADLNSQEKNITPANIREAAKTQARPTIPMPPEPIDVKEVVYDATGYEVPEHRVEFYNQGKELGKDLLTRVSSIRGALRRGESEKDPKFAFVSISTTVSLLNNLYGELTQLAPYVVCPYCQGQVSDHCMPCRKTGFLPKHQWERTVPEELKKVREKAIKKK